MPNDTWQVIGALGSAAGAIAAAVAAAAAWRSASGSLNASQDAREALVRLSEPELHISHRELGGGIENVPFSGWLSVEVVNVSNQVALDIELEARLASAVLGRKTHTRIEPQTGWYVNLFQPTKPITAETKLYDSLVVRFRDAVTGGAQYESTFMGDGSTATTPASVPVSKRRL